MKGAALILIATIIGVSCTAQTLKVTYTGTDNGLREMFKKMNSFPQNQGTSLFNEEEIKDRTTTLITDGCKSVFLENEETDDEDMEDNDGPEIIYISEDYWGEERKTYKNLTDSTLMIEQIYESKPFYISDRLRNLNWKITDEKEDIMGFECRKAVSGDTAIAWFTEDIPYPDGPSKSFGLPGLILRLDDGHEQYECVGIEEREKEVPAAPTRKRTMTEAKFREFLKKEYSRMGDNRDYEY